mmetsp:Transcript_69167/g.193331  ORF Transcript_69167/g.193331 Transcript_69167/m.193331 type:complete len:246 (-) Transcript_69167:273-1010(-)
MVSSHGSWSSGWGAHTALRHIGQFDCCSSHCNMHGKWKWCLQAGRHTISSPSIMSSAQTGHSMISCSCSSIFASSPALFLSCPQVRLLAVVVWSWCITLLTAESFRYCTTSCDAGSSAALAAFIVSVTCVAAFSVDSKSALRFWVDWGNGQGGGDAGEHWSVVKRVKCCRTCWPWSEKKTILNSNSSGFRPELPPAPPDEDGLAMIVPIISCRFWNSKNSLPHRGHADGLEVCTRYTRRHAWHKS